MLVEIEHFVNWVRRSSPGYVTVRDRVSLCYTCSISVER